MSGEETSPAAVAMAGGRARWRTGREKGATFIGALALGDDGWRREMLPPCYGGSGGTRTAATPPSDRRSMARSAVWRGRDGARRLAGAPGPGDARAHGQGASRAVGPRAVRGARTPRAAGATSRPRALHPDFNLLVLCLNSKSSKCLKRT
jgi:hypothetical protein